MSQNAEQLTSQNKSVNAAVKQSNTSVDSYIQQSYSLHSLHGWNSGILTNIRVVPVLTPIGYGVSIDDTVEPSRAQKVKTTLDLKPDKSHTTVAQISTDTEKPIQTIQQSSQRKAVSIGSHTSAVDITATEDIYTAGIGTGAKLPVNSEKEEELLDIYTWDSVNDYSGISIYQFVDVSFRMYGQITSSELVNSLTICLGEEDSIPLFNSLLRLEQREKINFKYDSNNENLQLRLKTDTDSYQGKKLIQTLISKNKGISTISPILIALAVATQSVIAVAVSLFLVLGIFRVSIEVDKERNEFSNKFDADISLGTDTIYNDSSILSETVSTVIQDSRINKQIDLIDTSLEEEDIYTQAESVTIIPHKRTLKAASKDIEWTLGEEPVAEDESIDFFIEYGFEHDFNNEFNALLLPAKTNHQPENSLLSDCEQWYLIPK